MTTELRHRLKDGLLSDLLVRRFQPMYYQYRRLLERWQSASADEAAVLSEELLDRTLRWAAATPYAHARGLGRDLSEWPILEKETVRDDPGSLRRKGVPSLGTALTSGTTGTPLAIRRCWPSVVFEQAAVDEVVAKVGVAWARSRIAVLRGDNVKDPTDLQPPFWTTRQHGRVLVLSSNHLNRDTVGSYTNRLRAFRPEVLWAYPTPLGALCDLADRDDLKLPSLRAIFASSETLTAPVLRKALACLGTPVIDRYGQAELVCSAWALHACRAVSESTTLNTYFFSPACGHVELQWSYADERHEYYEIIGTSFWNSAQPLVRFQTDDLARLPKKSTAHQRREICLGLRAFCGIDGRQSDYLVSPDGAKLIGINHIPRGIAEAQQMQVHQPSEARVEIWVVPGTGYGAATEARIRSNARLKIPESMNVDIIMKRTLFRTERGKTPLVVRHGAPRRA